MKEFILRLLGKSQSPEEEQLKPEICQCDHERCCHEKGKGKCHVGYPPGKEWPYGASCACQLFIKDDDSDDDDEPETPVDPDIAELNKILKT